MTEIQRVPGIMMYRSLTLAALFGLTSGFAPTPTATRPAAAASSRAAAAPRCEMTPTEAIFSRRAALAGVAGAVIGLGGQPVTAGYVTSLGIETTTPKDADIDDELLATKGVQDAIKNLKGYKSAASGLKGQFDSNTDLELIPSIRKEFDFSQLRNDLNVASTVFDDTTQLTIDRLSRSYAASLLACPCTCFRWAAPASPRGWHRVGCARPWRGLHMRGAACVRPRPRLVRRSARLRAVSLRSSAAFKTARPPANPLSGSPLTLAHVRRPPARAGSSTT